MGMEHEDGVWGRNTALYGILIIIGIIFLFWWCYQSGKDKADLAASIQNLYGEINCIKPVVKNNAEQLYDVNGTLKGVIQGVEDIRERSYENLASLNKAVFTSRFNTGRNGGGCTGTGYVKRERFESCGTELEQIESCGNV